MRLSALIAENSGLVAGADVEIRGLTADSRRVVQGDLFAALPGSRHDGHDYISQAVERGASALLVKDDVDINSRLSTSVNRRLLPVVRDRNPRRRFSLMAARFYRQRPRVIAAVTGTNGKTSVADFTRQIWGRLKLRAASLGTLGLTTPDRREKSTLTTPDPVTIHKTLKSLATNGIDHVVLEASSHGLDQYRLDGIGLTAAAFTNFTRDHLDYHGDLDRYFQSKLRLFREVLSSTGVAVINADDEKASTIEDILQDRGQSVIQVGTSAPEEGNNIKLESRIPTDRGQQLRVIHDEQVYDIELPLVGGFQASNAFVAAGLIIACGGEPASVFDEMGSLVEVPGRLQRIGEGRDGAPIFIDYAHTPDALRAVLSAVRPHATGSLHVVFGAGGDRDRLKRELMGRIAAEFADRVTITDDNPRTEDASAIRREILAAIPEAEEIGDRGAAIEHAIAVLGKGDALVIAGKGHETGQIVGDRILPFSDEEEVCRVLAASGRVS